MSATPEMKPHPLVIDKQRVRELADRMNQLIGFVPDPTVTALQAQQQLLESGVRPEDNELSCEIIRNRERNMPLGVTVKMPILFWDASGLAKRFFSEAGSATVNAIFDSMPRPVTVGTFWGYTETFAILARKKNAGQLKPADLASSMSALYNEVAASKDFALLSISDAAVMGSVTHILAHNINSADAALLAVFLDYQASLPDHSPPCVLVTADLRLTRAAQAEGLQTLNPEEAAAFLASLS